MARAPRSVIVAGSMNLDLIARVDHLPAPGEAVHATELRRDLGGKGFNQAVAARRLGAAVEMVGALGSDPAGDEFLARLDQLGIGRRAVSRVATPTGLALPVVDSLGQNWIVVALGANLELQAEQVAAVRLTDGAALLLQGELRADTNAALAARARRQGLIVILNAAPAAANLESSVALADLVVVNQVEAAALGGADRLLMLGADQVVVTLGPAGAALQGRVQASVPAPHIAAVDTTGAGDAFVAALAVALLEGRSPLESAHWAAAAGAAACLKPGSSGSMPDRAAVDALLGGAPRPRV